MYIVQIVWIKHLTSDDNDFKLEYTTINCDYESLKPKDLSINIVIKGRDELAKYDKYETTFNISCPSMSDNALFELNSSFSESLQNLWMFTHEKALQNGMSMFADIQKKAVMNVEFEHSLKLEKINADKFYSSINNA
jgi:hypothetical protein